jgi:hypothetical protein
MLMQRGLLSYPDTGRAKNAEVVFYNILGVSKRELWFLKKLKFRNCEQGILKKTGN